VRSGTAKWAFTLPVIAAVACISASYSPATRTEVAKVKVLRITQQVYQPLAVRIEVRGSVGHTMYVGMKIFDFKGRGVYSPPVGRSSPSSATYTQPYYDTSLTLRWNKVAYDGSRPPKNHLYYVVAYASDITSNGKLLSSSSYAFDLTT